MSTLIRVAIADDHQATVDGYLYRLGRYDDIEVVGTAFNGQELEALLVEQPADVLILDINLPMATNNPHRYPILHAIPNFLQLYPSLTILIISMHNEGTLINEVIKAGACGYILKDDRKTIQNLGSAVRLVAEGGRCFSEEALEHWQKLQWRGIGANLTPRQAEALSLCAAHPGITTRQLAKKMSIAPGSARKLLSGAYERLDVNSREAAIAKARQLGLITPILTVEAHRMGK